MAPITSIIWGVPSEVGLTEADGMKGACAMNLHNVVTVFEGASGPPRGGAQCGANERTLPLPGIRSWLYFVTASRRALEFTAEAPRN